MHVNDFPKSDHGFALTHLYLSGTKYKHYKKSVRITLYSLMHKVAPTKESQNCVGDKRENSLLHGSDLGCRG